MSAQNQTELWKQFNLAENNQDPGGGILYALRYGTEDLERHQAAITEVLVAAGSSIREVENGLAVDTGNLNPAQKQKVLLFLEELSVVNEALEYRAAGVISDSLSELSNQLKSSYIKSLTPKNKVDAYDLVSVGIPQIVDDLLIAHFQNDVLSPQDLREVRDLQGFAAQQTDTIGNHHIIVVG